jgi:hypothetical protein
MIPNKLIEAVVIFVFMMAAAGQLPKLKRAVQVAQFQVLKDSRSSMWGKPMLLPITK